MFLFETPMHHTEGTAEFMSKETTACFGGTTLWQLTGGCQGDVPWYLNWHHLPPKRPSRHGFGRRLDAGGRSPWRQADTWS